MPLPAETNQGEQGKTLVPRQPRRRVALSGRLETLSDRHALSVKNLSCKGALVEGEDLPDVGREGVLVANRLDCYCRVVWADGDRRGLEFDEPIEMSLVLELHNIIPDPRLGTEEEVRQWFEAQGKFARI